MASSYPSVTISFLLHNDCIAMHAVTMTSHFNKSCIGNIKSKPVEDEGKGFWFDFITDGICHKVNALFIQEI